MLVVRVAGQGSVDHIQVLAIALVAFVASSSLEANERIVRGHVHGIDSDEGVWVGIVAGEPSYDRYRRIPHDDFESDEAPETKNNWSFSQKGEFEIKTSVDEAAVLFVVGKNRLPIEVPLHPEDEEHPIEVSVSPGVMLKGSVRTEDGNPLVGATISVAPAGKSHRIPLFALSTWETAKDGSFELGGLKERHNYTLAVTAKGYSPLILQAFKIPEGGIDGLEIELEKGHFVTGKVVAKGTEVLGNLLIRARWSRDALGVVESDGKLKPKSGSVGRHYETGTRTGSDGSFRIGPFAKGTTGRLYVGSESTGSAISQEISAPYDNLVLRLGQESIRGRVLDGTSGAPIENFSVRMHIGETRSYTIKSSDGEFDIPVLPIDKDGTKVRIYAPDYGHWTGELFQGSSGEYDIGDVTLDPQRTLRGTIRDGRTGSPMAGVRLFGQFDYLTSFAVSDEKGAFSLNRLDPRVNRLSLLVPRIAQASVDIPDGVEQFDIELHLDSVIEGSLVLPDNEPAKGVVELNGTGWMLPKKMVSEGTFRWEGLAPDTYTLKAKTDAGLVETRTVTLKENERLTDINLVVQPGWTARGTISGLEGIEYVEITAQDADARVLTRKRFGNGEYALHGLPLRVALVARSSSGHSLFREFLEGNEEGSPLDFHIEDESQLTGWLTTGGKPLSGMSLQIKSEDWGAVAANVTSTESGRYEARRLADGRHVVHTDTGHSFAIDISGNTTFNIDVPVNSLSGFVRGERTSLPIGGGLVKLVHRDSTDEGHGLELTKRIGSDGFFLFEGLVSGDYDVVVEHPHSEAAFHRKHISGVETVDLTVSCANTRECFEDPMN